MEFDDKPAPGGSYLLFIHCVMGGALLLELWALRSVMSLDEGMVTVFVLGHSVLMVGVIYWGLLHAAYKTRYTVNGGKLDIRCGIFKSSVNLSQVLDVEKTGTITRTIGWGFGSSAYCNRFRNGVVLIKKKEKVFLSPSNPDIFMDYIRSILPEQDARE